MAHASTRSSLAACAALVLAGGACVAPGGTRSADALARVEALEQRHLDAGLAVPEVDLLALSPEMRRFARDHGADLRRPGDRLRALHRALFGPEGRGIRYDARARHTARETFESRRGNCLALASLVIALAREAGVDAHYQEVYVAPAWTERADLLLVQRHVEVAGRLGRGDNYTIDFLDVDTSDITFSRAVSDERARAQHYNNLAAEDLARGEHAAALAHFKRALRSDPALDYAWSNLGAAYRRAGESAAAEAAYREALALDPASETAASNLAALYRSQGRSADAEHYERLVHSYRLRNPYYHAQLAAAAMAEGDLARAIGEYRRALALGPGVERFRSGLEEALRRRDEAARGPGASEPGTADARDRAER
jgi:Flp pilus assembly protein TadD